MPFNFNKFGREAEYLAGLYLKNCNWQILFSKGSRGPADIIARKNNKTLLIQVKSSTKIPKIHGYEIQNLIKMSNKITDSYPVVLLVHPQLNCNLVDNSIIVGNYLLNFFLLPDWKSISII